MSRTARVALVTGCLFVVASGAGCGGAEIAKGKATAAAPRPPAAPAPAAKAPPAPPSLPKSARQGLRFARPALKEGELLGYKIASRTRLRMTDRGSGQSAEQLSSFARLEHTKLLAGGGLETTVVSDVERRDEETPQAAERVHPGYTVTQKGDDISVATTDRGKVVAPDYETLIRKRARAGAAHDILADFLSQSTFERGKRVSLPKPVLALLDEAESGSATLAAVEERWQRSVARFEIEVSRPASGDRPQLRGEANLYVELDTGRPVLLASTLRKTRRWKEQGKEVEGTSVETASRRWAVNRSDAYARSSFSVEPAPSVVGKPRQLAIAPDERSAAVLLDGLEGSELAVWDLGRRSVIGSWASDARFVLAEKISDTAMFYEVGPHSVTGHAMLTSGLKGVGTVMIADLTFAPAAAAAFGPWVAVGGADGRVLVAEPRSGCVAATFRSSLASIRAMAFASRDRLAVADPRGKVEVFDVASTDATAPAPGTCKQALRATSKQRFDVPTLVARIDAQDGTFLFASLDDDVFVSTPSGPPRALGKLGAEATLTRTAGAASGAVDAVTTRLGTTPLTASPMAGRRTQLPSGSSAMALGRSGRFGLSAEGHALSFFEPGPARDGARLSTLTSPVAGAIAHGKTLVAASNEGSGARLVTWDLGSASATSRSLGQGSGSAALVATADGSRHAITTADRVEIRDTSTGAVIRAWKRSELAPGDAPLGAKLGRAGFSVAGLALAVTRRDGAVSVRDVSGAGATVDLPAGSATGPASFALSPTEGLLLSVGSDGRLVATEVPSGRTRFAVKATTPGASVARAVVVSRDGEWVAISDTHREGSPWNPQIPVVEVRSTKDGSLVSSLSPSWLRVTALSFSADKNLVFAGTDDGRLLTWDAASGLLVSNAAAHQRKVTSLFASASGTQLVSTSADGSVRLWDPRVVDEQKGAGVLGVLEEAVAPWRPTQLLATLVVDVRGDAVVATGDGYYKADRGSLRSLALTSASARYELLPFDSLLHRPDVVLERLGAGDDERLALFRAAHAKREQVLRGRTPQSLPKAPKVSLTQPLPLFTKDREVVLRLNAAAAEGQLRALHVAVDSVPVGPVNGTPLSGSSWSGAVPITLGAGANRVEVYATDARGAVSEVASHVVQYTGPVATPSLYAVVVGVSKYANPSFDLDYAAKDAKDVGATLSASKRFAAVHVHEILDQKATRDEILAARSFLEKARHDDTVVVFLAGHGLLDKNLDYWFATTDIDPKAPGRNGLSYEKLASLVTGLSARRRLVLLDTCHAGEADRTAAGASAAASAAAKAPQVADAPSTRHMKQFRGLELEQPVPKDQSFGLMQQLFADLRAGSGAIVLGSAGGAELALESARYKNGVFTYALLEALKENKGDADGSGEVSATELVRYVRSRVEQLTGGEQRPATRGENLDLDFPIF